VTVQDTMPPELSLPGDVNTYGWNGFQPIDNGNVVNKAKAGQSIPIKFSLTGSAAVNYPAPTATDLVDGSVQVTCKLRERRSCRSPACGAAPDAAHADRAGAWLLNSSSRAVAVSAGCRSGK
jgi:hypothetical protein